MISESAQTTIQKMLTTTPPAFSGTEAIDIAARHYGVRAKVRPQVSDRDQNFRLDTADGRRLVLKISNHAEQMQVVDFQNRALLHVAEKDAAFPLPRVIPTLNGQLHCKVERDGRTHIVRVLSWLDGVVLNNTNADADLVNRMGRLLARLGLALKHFDHPGSNPPSLWDMKRASGLRELLVFIEDPRLRQLIGQTLDCFDTRVKPVLGTLRTQIIHNDMNPDNVLLDENRTGQVSGLIDFGDMVKSPLIFDLAIASAYQLGDGDKPLEDALPMIAGYHAVRPLQELEMALLPDLIKTRLITSLLIGSYRVTLFPENREYLLTSYTSAKNYLLKLQQQNTGEALQQIRAVCP